VVVTTLLFYSYIYSSSWINVYLNNDSKGGLSTVLFRFIADNEIAKITWRVVALFLIYLLLRKLILINKDYVIKIKEFTYKKINYFNKYLSFKVEIIGYIILFSICYLVLQKNETKVFYSLLLVYFCINLYKYFANDSDDKFQLISVALLMLAYAGTMTAGYNNVSLELLIAVFLTVFFKYYSKLFNLRQFFITLIVLILSITLFYNQKYNKSTYNWWGYSTDTVFNSNYYSNNPKLKSISFDYLTKEILEATDSAISSSQPSDEIFAYPSIPIFYWLYEKKPIVNNIVQWFDVMPTSVVNKVLDDLRLSQPKFIFWLKPPGFVYQGHLMMKRTALPMNAIDDYIYGQLDNGGYRIIKSIPIVPGYEVNNNKSFRRYIAAPINYEFLCKKCSNEELNKMLIYGSIINYNKSMDYTNNNYINIKFKNPYEANLFISKYNLIPINQSDWIFYILERR
jgi:hypothetical protein